MRDRSPLRSAVVAFATFAVGLAASGAPRTATTRRTLQVLTYNVAGLPEGLSASRPVQNLPLIGARLNRFDLALIQEDFAYAELLRKHVRLPYSSRAFVRGERYDFGDGLSQFGRDEFDEPERITWASCHGFTGFYFDCLTPKGVSFTRVRLSDNATLDVYNLHMDAGRSAGDQTAREQQLEQLQRLIRERSAGRAVLIGGDFNLTTTDSARLRAFERETGTRDACARLGCPEPGRIDRILSRSSERISLTPKRWRVDRSFVNERGEALSDHMPVAVEFELELAQKAAE